jgi:hypothetical protein
MPTEKSICQNRRCARPYVKVRGNQKYCSERCRIQALHVRNYTHKGKRCHWCGERFKVNFETISRSYCYKKECIRRQWFWGLLKRYNRCKQCHSITPRGRTAWRSTNYCPFCVGSVSREIKERYVKWLKNLPRHVTALLPNPVPPVKHATQYVKAYDINNVKFQIFYPQSKNSELKK